MANSEPDLAGCGFIALFCIAAVVYGVIDHNYCSSPNTPSRPSVATSPPPRDGEAERIIAEFQEDGSLPRIDFEIGRFYVEPLLWNGSDINTKENLGRMCARYMKSKGRSMTVEIFDFRSGKRLAKYNPVWDRLSIDE